MAKIPNWSLGELDETIRRYHRPVIKYWKHDQKMIELVIMREDAEVLYKTDSKEFGVLVAEVAENGNSFSEITHEEFDTKKNAEEWSRDYMYKHPNPKTKN